MKNLKTFEQYSEFSGEEHVDEIFGLGKKNDDKIKADFFKYANSPAWQKKPFFLYLGDDKFVKLRMAKDSDRKAAYEIIKDQAANDKTDKFGGGIGIYGSEKTGESKFICYKPSAAIKWSAGDVGTDFFAMPALASTKAEFKEFQEIGNAILPKFEAFIESRKA